MELKERKKINNQFLLKYDPGKDLSSFKMYPGQGISFVHSTMPGNASIGKIYGLPTQQSPAINNSFSKSNLLCVFILIS